MRRLAGPVGAALLFALGALLIGGRLNRSWAARVAVAGHSMEPTLRHGEWILVDPLAFARRRPRPGELVVARDPRELGRVIVKRVGEVADDGRLTLTGDHPAHADDGAAIGPVGAAGVLGKPWFRYWPAKRIGRIS